jgi:hypothetical protein
MRASGVSFERWLRPHFDDRSSERKAAAIARARHAPCDPPAPR